MNTYAKNVSRRTFLTILWRLESEGKEYFYLDETNYNTWCSREYGWSVTGKRAVVKRTTSKGENMQVIASIGRGGLVYHESKFGTNRAEHMHEYVRELLGVLAQYLSLDDVIVLTTLHAIVALRIPMLNPIENVFSAFKSDVKRSLRQRRQELLTIPPNTTIKAHRGRILEEASQETLQVVTPSLCAKCFLHTRKFYEAVINLEDMQVGT
ncbi:hypothetical protein H310_06646 [Aphanomyces invadans]|uniref:Tc1-like transposase DDE domain-containing protein n=1 Tax=Aphanomyces invadans TaxID=157072 RepID=A0A024U466_9STRA|nr:hypothetical protein H310_06646 [Aphanomyces invadans]ETW01010.1 hypothetical protein H310_06646 [Aphanomyces invadans]|eukprot:XP_008870008.1 hypothetical protein H310_06646 [Aphanomyces invadans]